MKNLRTLITQANGKTGRRVADRLEALGHDVRRGTRRGEHRFDWDDLDSWAPALEGIDQVYLTYSPDLAFPGADTAIEAFTRLASDAGVQRIVLLSGRNEPAAERCERIVQRSGIAWTVIRASFFAQNFSEGIFVEPLQGGALPFPGGQVKEPFVDIDDIADIAVAALTSSDHDSELYEITGPKLLTFGEAVATIGEATGRELRYLPVSLDEYRGMMADAGLPLAVVDEYIKLFAMITDGRNASVTDGVMRALGRPARSFDDFVRAAAETGAWREAAA